MTWHDPTAGPRGRGDQDGRIRRAFASLAKRVGRVRVEELEAATTPGAVTYKLPIYDADGAVVGYVALYDDIT